MNKRNIILVSVVVVLFGLSAFIVYQGIYANSGSQTAVLVGSSADVAGSQKEIVNLLPYGERLDFTLVQNRAQNTQPFTYEPVDANTVGVDMRSLIAPGNVEITSAQKTSVDKAVRENPLPERGQRASGQ